jgi:hypothetical protein
MAGDVSALPAKEPTLTLSLPERADPVSRPLACASDALVTDFQKITLEDQFDVPAR